MEHLTQYSQNYGIPSYPYDESYPYAGQSFINTSNMFTEQSSLVPKFEPTHSCQAELNQLKATMSVVMTCSICCELMVAPHILRDCGHAFCGHCLSKWLDLRKSHCPECRTKIVNRSKAMFHDYKLSCAVDTLAETVLGPTEKEERETRKREWDIYTKSRKRSTEQKGSTTPRRRDSPPEREFCPRPAAASFQEQLLQAQELQLQLRFIEQQRQEQLDSHHIQAFPNTHIINHAAHE